MFSQITSQLKNHLVLERVAHFEAQVLQKQLEQQQSSAEAWDGDGLGPSLEKACDAERPKTAAMWLGWVLEWLAPLFFF